MAPTASFLISNLLPGYVLSNKSFNIAIECYPRKVVIISSSSAPKIFLKQPIASSMTSVF
jgi:hypothetical protein